MISLDVDISYIYIKKIQTTVRVVYFETSDMNKHFKRRDVTTYISKGGGDRSPSP